jgi:hypothetical protein
LSSTLNPYGGQTMTDRKHRGKLVAAEALQAGDWDFIKQTARTRDCKRRTAR